MADDNNSDLLGIEKTPGLERPDFLADDKKSSVDLKRSNGKINEKYDELLDFVYQENGGPGYSNAITGPLRGLRVLGPGNELAPLPDNVIGLSFVSRPSLNLTNENILRHEVLCSLVDSPRHSLQSYVRGVLDPAWAKTNNCDLLDPLSAWINPLTNLLKTSSGFPDVSLNIGKGSPGLRNQVDYYVDGILTFNGDVNIRQSYHSMKPNILPMLFETWVHYIEAVTLGDEMMSPYPEALIQNYKDYDCRIYHIILNKNMRNIEGIYCTGSVVPNMLPVGHQSAIDRTQESLRGQGQDEYEMNFEGVGFRYNSLLVCDMFNQTSYYRNENLKPNVRNNHYRKLTFKEIFEYQYGDKGGFYPLINISTMELEYWVKK